MGIQIKNHNPHFIPEITDPMGKYWEQPERERIFVDESVAILWEKDFFSLKNYSHSIPSGVYPGKMFRAVRFENKPISNGREFKAPVNYFNWYGFSEDTDKCSINSRKVIIVPETHTTTDIHYCQDILKQLNKKLNTLNIFGKEFKLLNNFIRTTQLNVRSLHKEAIQAKPSRKFWRALKAFKISRLFTKFTI